MAREIEIKEFRGVFTNADVEDLPPEFLTVCKNMRSYNGRLIKTFGPEVKISDTVDITNLATYIHKSLENNDLQEKVYIGVFIASSGSYGVVTLYGYDETTSTWKGLYALTDFNSSQTVFYHKKDKNPIIQVDGILRVLPGNIGELGGNESVGIWIGHIKRKLWDEIGTYDGFYVYPVTIEKPVLGLVDGYEEKIRYYNHDRIDAIEQDERYYYKFSYIYDGIQEGLLSDEVIYFDGNIDSPPFHNWFEILFSINKTGMNKRITGIKVYRSRELYSQEISGNFTHIHTIDFLRPVDKIKKADTGLFTGLKYVHIPELYGYPFYGGWTYEIWLDDAWHDIDVPAGINADIFHFTTDTINSDKWDVEWKLRRNGVITREGTSGAYSGYKTKIISEELDADYYNRGVIVIGNEDGYVYAHEIDKYFKKAIHTDIVHSVEYDDWKWRVMAVQDGLYFAEYGIYDKVSYRFYDTGLPEGSYHPLAGSPSIKANGDVAQIIGGRLWQGNPILDPGGKNEEHIGKVVYSEIGQYDVNAVGNLLSLPDREGGAITGIAEILGNPVFTKPHAIHTVDISVIDPPFPIIKSEHNIGNIAKHGLVQVGESLYVCYFDGIYRLTPNNLAESDDTPTERLKISDPIGDMYQGMTLERKKAIEARYDQRKGEIIYKMNEQLWAYNIDTGFWRQHDYDVTFSITALDENANIIIYDETNQNVYTLGGDDWVSTSIKTKQFRISDERAEVIRYFIITYQSVTALTLNLYTEYSDTPIKTYTLPKNEKIVTYKLGIRVRAEVFTFELIALSESESSQLWDLLGDDRVVIQEEPGDTDTVWDLKDQAAQDLTTYTEVDPNSRLTVTDSKVDVVGLLRNDGDTHVYKDLGIDYINGDYSNLFEVFVSAGDAGGLFINWMLSNDIDDWNGLESANNPYHGLYVTVVNGTIQFILKESVGGVGYQDSSIALALSTLYYITVERKQSVGDYGTLYAKIYDDAGRTNLLDTLTVTLHIKQNFRYIFAMNSAYFDNANSITGYTQNLDLNEDRVVLKDNPVSNHIWTVDGDRVYINPLVKTVINKIKIEHS